MRNAIQSSIHRADFQQWLNNGTAPLVVSHSPEESATFLKLSKLPKIDYIFGTVTVRAERIGWNDSLTFCGVYDQRSQRLYLADTPLTFVVDGITEEERDIKRYAKEICGQVNERVEAAVNNDRNNLSVKKVTDWRTSKDLKYYREYGAREEAIQRLFEDRAPDGQFHSDYALDGLPETAFLAWLQDPKLFIQTEAEQYLKDHQEDFLAEFLRNDALMAEYQALTQDAESPIHRMKAITDAVNRCGAKTVTVTVQKDGTELTFKAEAIGLKGYRMNYYGSGIPAQDRRKFEKAFGRYADYSAEDIAKITYGRNTIYEAPPVQTEEMTAEMEGMRFG